MSSSTQTDFTDQPLDETPPVPHETPPDAAILADMNELLDWLHGPEPLLELDFAFYLECDEHI